MAGDCEMGMVGLGVMGRNLLLNIADHGYRVAGYDQDLGRADSLRAEARGGGPPGAAAGHGGAETGRGRIDVAESPQELVELLRRPRAVMMLVPAGAPVNAVIAEVLPHLEQGDVIIDGGNSHFKDTDRRAEFLTGSGVAFLGVGISGGEAGARHGPSMMPGGPREAYERVRPVFEAAAARVDDQPCVAYMGPGSAGHYVKMVHNGIEYGLMQLIAETYDLMKRRLGVTNDGLQTLYRQWNQGELESYLLQITADIFGRVDEKTGDRLVDLILDEAGQLGTGAWDSQDAMALSVPVPTIEAAVAARNLSALKSERRSAAQILSGPDEVFAGDRETLLQRLRDALYAAMIVTFAQGMAQLERASQACGYGLDLGVVAGVWRGGCIIRARLLDPIRDAYEREPALENLLLSRLGHEVAARQEALREVVCAAAGLGVPAPALSASLAYFDAYRSARLPANLTQAQRDYFGSHRYRRIDAEGSFHTDWS